MRPRLIASLLLAGLLLAACNGEDPAPPEPGPTGAAPGPTSTGAAGIDAPEIPVPIEDATAARDALLQVAEQAAQPDPGENITPDFGVTPAWAEAYPGLSFSGGDIPSDPTTVSVYNNIQNAKDVEGEDNPYVLAAAIPDTQSNCAGLVAVGYPSLDEFIPVDDPSRCDPFTVAADGGYETFG